VVRPASGDTGLFQALRTIGERFGPFDLTMIEIGQYDRASPDGHLGPEQAVEVHRRVRGAVMLPVHWGFFALASHGWTEPIERALVAVRGRLRIRAHLTVADFVAAYTLDMASVRKGGSLLENLPRLHRYMERMYARQKAPPRITEAFASLRR